MTNRMLEFCTSGSVGGLGGQPPRPTRPPLAKLKGQALHWAKASLELALDEVDEADEDTFNRILWHAARGDAAPYPAEYVGARDAD
jgi:hypothetical protein